MVGCCAPFSATLRRICFGFLIPDACRSDIMLLTSVGIPFFLLEEQSSWLCSPSVLYMMTSCEVFSNSSISLIRSPVMLCSRICAFFHHLMICTPLPPVTFSLYSSNGQVCVAESLCFGPGQSFAPLSSLAQCFHFRRSSFRSQRNKNNDSVFPWCEL